MDAAFAGGRDCRSPTASAATVSRAVNEVRPNGIADHPARPGIQNHREIDEAGAMAM